MTVDTPDYTTIRGQLYVQYRDAQMRIALLALFEMAERARAFQPDAEAILLRVSDHGDFLETAAIITAGDHYHYHLPSDWRDNELAWNLSIGADAFVWRAFLKSPIGYCYCQISIEKVLRIKRGDFWPKASAATEAYKAWDWGVDTHAYLDGMRADVKA